MIKTNIQVTVTEKQASGEELLYNIRSMTDRSKLLLCPSALEVLVNDIPELLKAIGLVQKFGEENPTTEDTSKVVAQPDGTLVVEYGDAE